tara:strand:+ start:1929 stop:4565 length:2637 start_codon:yes stop_codon:yes gene_type:complete
MAIKDKIISFWKRVKLKSSDMFTLFRVGIGVKVPTNKLHIKDSKDPLKIEGLQNDTTDPDKYLTIDSSNIVKYRTGAEVLSDVIGSSTDFTMDDLTVDTIIFTGEDITTANDDFNITLDSGNAHSDSIFSINADSSSNFLFRIAEGAPTTYSFKRDTDAVLISEGNMTFRIDGDADETGQSFAWQNNSSTEIASLTEAGAFTTKNILLGDADATSTTIIKTPSTATNGGDLSIVSGDGVGANKTGGDLVLRAGDSTGNAAGGSILFKSTPVGSSGSSANATTNIVEIDNTGNLQIDGNLTVGGGDILNVASINSITDLDMLIISDGNISFRLDNDNDETGQSFSFNNYTTEIANLDEAGNLQIDGDLQVSGNDIKDDDGTTCITFDSSGNTTIAGTTSGTFSGNLSGTASGLSVTLDVNRGGTGATTLATNSLLTGNGTSAVQAEAGLTYDSETLTIGDDDVGTAIIERQTHSDDHGGHLEVKGGAGTGSNKNGGHLSLYAGGGTGSGTSGYIRFYGHAAGVGGSSANSLVEVAQIDSSGNLQIDGDLTVTGNDIKDSGGNSIISSNGSGVVTMAGGNISVGGTNANLEMNAGSDIILEADNAGGSGASSIQYKDSGGGNKIMLAANSDVVILSNRASNGTVQVRANTSTAGSGGEVTVATFEDDSITAAVPLFINAGGPNVAITCTSSDADCMVRVSDNSTAGTNVIGLVATGDDSIIRNDEGNFKVKMANNATTTLDLDQNGNLDITGNILPGITYVKILPSDFIADDGGRPLAIDDTTSDRWLESNGTNPMFASVEIPIGFKATHVDVYGSATSAITVYEADVNSATVTSKGTGNIGTQINITDVTADATNYLLIAMVQASGERVYGGKLTIAKV